MKRKTTLNHHDGHSGFERLDIEHSLDAALDAYFEDLPEGPGANCIRAADLRGWAAGTLGKRLARQISLHLADCGYCMSRLREAVEAARAVEEPRRVSIAALIGEGLRQVGLPLRGLSASGAMFAGDSANLVAEDAAHGLSWVVIRQEGNRTLSLSATKEWIKEQSVHEPGAVVVIYLQDRGDSTARPEWTLMALKVMEGEGFGTMRLSEDVVPVQHLLGADSAGEAAIAQVADPGTVPADRTDAVRFAILQNLDGDEQAKAVWDSFVSDMPTATRDLLVREEGAKE